MINYVLRALHFFASRVCKRRHKWEDSKKLNRRQVAKQKKTFTIKGGRRRHTLFACMITVCLFSCLICMFLSPFLFHSAVGFSHCWYHLNANSCQLALDWCEHKWWVCVCFFYTPPPIIRSLMSVMRLACGAFVSIESISPLVFLGYLNFISLHVLQHSGLFLLITIMVVLLPNGKGWWMPA